MGLKREGTEQLSIQWELGILDDGYIAGQVTYTERISVSDIDGLKTFKLREHPEIWKETIEGKKGAQHPEIRPQIEAMSSSTRLWLPPSSHSRRERIARGSTRSTCLVGTFLSDARCAFTLKHMPLVHQLRL